MAELFPEFEIIDHPVDNSYPVLEECVKKLRIVTDNENIKKESNRTIKICEPGLKKFYDPNLNKIKRMENDRKVKVYEDDIETINKSVKQSALSEQPQKKSLLGKFFTKKIATYNKIDKVS